MVQEKSFFQTEACDTEDTPMLIEEGLEGKSKQMQGARRMKRVLVGLVLVASIAAMLLFTTRSSAMEENARSPAEAALGKKINKWTSDFNCDCNYVNVGELRNFAKQSKCLGVSYASRRRRRKTNSVSTENCDNAPDQTWCECDDGSYRNGDNMCLRSYGDVDYCQESTDPVVFWSKYSTRTETDDTGVDQNLFQLSNKDNDECFDIAGTDGDGSTGTHSCESWSESQDQQIYFRSRGALAAYGALQNQDSDLCLEVISTDADANVITATCSGESNQIWKLYTNGELVSALSGFCVEVDGTDGEGDIDANSCEGASDQLWTVVGASSSGSFANSFYFKNQKSSKCLGIDDGHAVTETCGQADQYYKWQSTEWTAMQDSWELVHCNQGGSYTESITTTVGGSESMTAELAITIGASIEKSVGVYTGSAYVELTATLSKSWEQNWETSKTKEVTCDTGIMYQYVLSTSKETSGDVNWKTPYTVCTTTCVTPKCPPNYEPDDDDECYQCADSGCGALAR